jgi:hypothetical protein
MVGAFALAIALVMIGIVLMVVVPGVGWLLGILAIIFAVVLLVGAFTGPRRARTSPRA